MEYKGYLARVRYDTVTQTWEGEVVGLAQVCFQSKKIESVEAAFHEALDRYLDRQQILSDLKMIHEGEKEISWEMEQ